MKEKEKTWRRDPFLLLSLALVLLIMAVIFRFSSQSREQSGETSGRVDNIFISWLCPDFDRLSEEEQEVLSFRVDLIVRKTAHLLEFAALGFALRLHLQALSRWRPIRRPQLLAWGIGKFYAATDELHLVFTGRAGRLTDVGIDSLGVFLGILFYLLCAALLRKKKA